ncbi:albumin [Trifolium medium]|uniref:Albumin n=1 Tax=Trifolium medium TaxID=97028 RepID=A0A392M2G9_9FABA|nr:albumin [Trifolium medium]
MTYAKLAPLAVFLLATFLMFPTKNVEACGGLCSVFDSRPVCGGGGCTCMFYWYAPVMGECQSIHNAMRQSINDTMVEESPYLCNSHADCTIKGSGSFCARYPNNPYNVKYGWCFASKYEAEDYVRVVGSRYKFNKDLLKMPTSAEY